MIPTLIINHSPIVPFPSIESKSLSLIPLGHFLTVSISCLVLGVLSTGVFAFYRIVNRQKSRFHYSNQHRPKRRVRVDNFDDTNCE